MTPESDALPEFAAFLDPRDGEDITSRSLELAERWIGFYDDLATFERRILESMEELSARLPADRRAAIEESNVEPMRRLIGSFERRAAMWRARGAEIRREDPPS